MEQELANLPWASVLSGRICTSFFGVTGTLHFCCPGDRPQFCSVLGVDGAYVRTQRDTRWNFSRFRVSAVIQGNTKLSKYVALSELSDRDSRQKSFPR